MDLGVNNTAVFTAISVNDPKNIHEICSELYENGHKNIHLTDIPSKILKVKVMSGFLTKNKKKQLRNVENKRRKLGKEVGNKRFNLTDHTNHKVSSEIVKFASQFKNPIVIFEKNLTNMKNAFWSPADVKTKTEYKLKSKGIWTFDVYAAYTSMLCHKCGSMGIRDKDNISNFYCPSCGLGRGSTPHESIGQYNADVNASINIALRGLYVLTRKGDGCRDGIVVEPNVLPNDNT